MGTVTKWGTQMSGASLQRTRVAANYQAYVIPLGDNVLSKLMAYVQGFGYVECTPEEALQNKLSAYPAYFMLVGRLDMEPTGAFRSGGVTMEYIQLGSNAYTNLIQARSLNASANAICVMGQANKRNQVTMTYMPVVLQLPLEVQQRIEAFMAKPEMLLSALQMLDANTGRPVARYLEWLQGKQGTPVGSVPTGGVQAPYPPMSQVAQGPIPPASDSSGHAPGLGPAGYVPGLGPAQGFSSAPAPGASQMPPQVPTAAPMQGVTPQATPMQDATPQVTPMQGVTPPAAPMQAPEPVPFPEGFAADPFSDDVPF